MNLSELTQDTDQPMSTAMDMSVDGDRANPDNPTPPVASAEVGTTVVGMGPVGTLGTQSSVSSEILGANPHITSSQALPTQQLINACPK
eukprot:5787619-Amphidinium_carterae.3